VAADLIKRCDVKLERESKLELSHSDFLDLLNLSKVKRYEDQLNVYYDWSGMLLNNAATCRIRLSNIRQATLTLKIPVQHTGYRRDAMEFEYLCDGVLNQWIPSKRINVDQQLPDEVAQQLEAIGINALERIGWLRNKRWVVELRGHEIELDESHLPDGTIVFEAEIESDDPDAHEALVEFIVATARTARPSRMNKFQRFVGALDFTDDNPRPRVKHLK
jgi:uncharacterized protein YjbK